MVHVTAVLNVRNEDELDDTYIYVEVIYTDI